MTPPPSPTSSTSAAKAPQAPDGAPARVQRIYDKLAEATEARNTGNATACHLACIDALQQAMACEAFEAMIDLREPLGWSITERHTKTLAENRVTLVDDELPEPDAIKTGCYVVCPPRVGADGRMLREQALRVGVPVIVIVREPPSMDGRWPVVALGPTTVRTKLMRPKDVEEPRPGKPGETVEWQLPPQEWVEAALKALGEEAVTTAMICATADARVEALAESVIAHPDSQYLLDSLVKACKYAIDNPEDRRRRSRQATADDDNDSDSDDDDNDSDDD